MHFHPTLSNTNKYVPGDAHEVSFGGGALMYQLRQH